MKKIKELILKNKEIISYLVFGVLTTLVNFSVYYFASLKIEKTISNMIAWFISVLFAYVTNKLYVFKSTQYSFSILINEVIKFFGCRFFSGILDIAMFFVMVDILKINDFITKCFIAVFVVVLNYIFSKLFIFKAKKENSYE